MADDIYDFSGVSDELNQLKEELLRLHGEVFANRNRNNNHLQSSSNNEDDDEEWYPPTPPPYDATDKLIEVNRQLEEDPTSLHHQPSKNF